MRSRRRSEPEHSVCEPFVLARVVLGRVDMRTVQGVILAVAVLGGALFGLGAYTFVYARGWSLLNQRSRGLCQLSRHARAVRRVAEWKPSRRRPWWPRSRRRRASSARRSTSSDEGRSRSGRWSRSLPAAERSRLRRGFGYAEPHARVGHPGRRRARHGGNRRVRAQSGHPTGPSSPWCRSRPSWSSGRARRTRFNRTWASSPMEARPRRRRERFRPGREAPERPPAQGRQDRALSRRTLTTILAQRAARDRGWTWGGQHGEDGLTDGAPSGNAGTSAAIKTCSRACGRRVPPRQQRCLGRGVVDRAARRLRGCAAHGRWTVRHRVGSPRADRSCAAAQRSRDERWRWPPRRVQPHPRDPRPVLDGRLGEVRESLRACRHHRDRRRHAPDGTDPWCSELARRPSAAGVLQYPSHLIPA